MCISYYKPRYYRYPTANDTGSHERERMDADQGIEEDFPEALALEGKQNWRAVGHKNDMFGLSKGELTSLFGLGHTVFTTF